MHFWRIAGLILILSCLGCKDELIHNLSETDANRVITALHDQEIEVSKVAQPDGRWSIEVASSDSIRALKLLNQTRLIKGTETVSRERASVISSREDQRFQFERSLSEEIERTVSNLPGALEVRVHLNMPLVDPLFGHKLSKDEGSGSVLLIAEHDSQIQKEEVASLVSGASGIPAAKISVLISFTKLSNLNDRQLEPKLLKDTDQESNQARVLQEAEVLQGADPKSLHLPTAENVSLMPTDHSRQELLAERLNQREPFIALKRLGITPLELAFSLLILGVGMCGLVFMRKRLSILNALKRIKAQA